MASNIISERGIGHKGKDCMTRGLTSPHRHNHNKGLRREHHMNMAKFAASNGTDDRFHPGKRKKAVSTPG